jgi:hypothetical protein
VADLDDELLDPGLEPPSRPARRLTADTPRAFLTALRGFHTVHDHHFQGGHMSTTTSTILLAEEHDATRTFLAVICRC